MSRLKVLPLPLFFSDVYKDEIIPTFKRNGYYLLNGEAWYEHNGKAYSSDAESFMHDYWYITTSEYPPEVVKGLEAICKTSFATKEQRRLWAHLEVHRDLNSISFKKIRLNAFRLQRDLMAKLAEWKARKALEAQAV